MAIGNYNPVAAVLETDTLVTHALFKSCLYEDKRKKKKAMVEETMQFVGEILGHLYYKYLFLVYNHLNYFQNTNAFVLLNIYLM